jgi:predicted MPP superfamily phosphohydrolase
VFFFVALGVTTLGHGYLYWRFRDALGRDRRRWVLALVGLLALCVLAMPLFFVTGFGRNPAASWISFIAMGVFSLLGTLRIMADLVVVGGKLALWRRQGRDVDEGRRLFMRRAVDASVVGGAAVMGTAGVYSAATGPEIYEVEVPVKGLAAELEGFRIAQISDLHVGPTIGRDFVEPVVRWVNDLKPDLIAVTGDLVDGTVDQLRDGVAPLADLKATCGTWYVTGNHEYYSGCEPWVEHVKTLGMTPLMNEHAVVEHAGAKLVVAGVTDLRAHRILEDHRCDPARCAKDMPEADLKLLLAHQPNTAFKAEGLGFDLQLSGHTHGGQFFPWNFVIHLAQPFVAGLYRHKGTQLYVNRGTAWWGPPVRLGPTSEITLLKLKRA